LTYKRHRADLVAQVEERIQSEFNRLKGESERGEWIELPPSKEMTQIGQHLEQLGRYIKEGPSGDRAQAAGAIEALQRHWVEADFARRINLAEEIEAQPPSLIRRLFPHMVAMFTSRGFARDSGVLAKACSYAGTAIMLLSLVGIYHGPNCARVEPCGACRPEGGKSQFRGGLQATREQRA
jgi:hypothetical protein